MSKKLLLLLVSLFVFTSVSFGEELEQMKIATAKKKMISVYNKVPMGTNASKAFGLKKGDSLVVVVKPKVNKDYYKVVIDDELHGWVANNDIKVLKDSRVYSFEELEIKYNSEDKLGIVFGEEIPPTKTLKINISFMDKIQTDAPKDEIERHTK